MHEGRPPVLAEIAFAARREEFAGLPRAERFARIYETNLWGAQTSASGLGSERAATAELRRGLADLLLTYGIRSMLDLSCGDFNWMAAVNLAGIRYLGADIVADIITANATVHGRPGQIDFMRLDIVTDPLPSVDLVMCRDCLVHLSDRNISYALANIRRSKSRWLLTTTFLDINNNRDIEDGDWRALNLQRTPFDFAAPRHVIVEGCTEAGGSYADKALAWWAVDDLPVKFG